MADRLYKGPFNEDMRLIDMGDGTFAERFDAYPSKKFLTDDGGDYARLRVDVGQTGFFAGREVRMFHEFDLSEDSTRVIKVVSPVDVILQMFKVELELSSVRIEIVSGGTEGGTFSNSIATFKTNNMTTASDYSPQVTMAYGGTHTGGTIIDLITAYSGSNRNKSVSSSGVELFPIGFSAGTYYIRIENTDSVDAEGLFRAQWEERP